MSCHSDKLILFNLAVIKRGIRLEVNDGNECYNNMCKPGYNAINCCHVIKPF